MFHIILLLWLSNIESSGGASSQAKPGCQERCGKLVIPYPFGIGSNCSFDEGFALTCNNSFNPPKPFLNSINLEVLQISVNGTVQVNNPVITSNCPGRANGLDVNLIQTPFSFSNTYNRFTATGCNNLALITRQATVISGCMSICNVNSTSETGCYGINCCQTTIPPLLKFINASLRNIEPDGNQNDCKYAFMVDEQWFSDKDIYTTRDMEYVPAVLDWVLNGTCNTNSSASSFCGPNAYCSRNQTWSSRCNCERGFEGNPYLPSGCQDIDECADPRLNRCEKLCMNLPGTYQCYCPGAGYLSTGYGCIKLLNNSSRTKVIVLGTCSGLGVLLLVIGLWRLRKIVNRRKETKLKEKFFKRNGGLLLKQQLAGGKGNNFDATKLFTSKELEKATDNYNSNRILGRGGQGTVYKGMLTDGRIVAIKKSKIMDEGKLEQFINEVVILSQINHRNVVKLLGCCLETEVPMLVYEFIPNGTLFHYIHDRNEEFPLSWVLRLRIATEVAGALSYLHSAASIPIYHRDIKSTNILLDEKYRAKVSDFGISRSIAEDQTHLTTAVQGTFGYLDPEYFRSSQFTEKSDVYSFGVVLVELLTGEKPILPARSEEGRSLAVYFIETMKENRLFDILDARVVKEGGKEEILAVARLTKRCLNLNGRKRPTMKEVVTELDVIRLSNGASPILKQSGEKVEYAIDKLTGPWEAASTSSGSLFGTNAFTSSGHLLCEDSL